MLPPRAEDGASLLATPPLPSGPHRDLLLLMLRGLPDLDDGRLIEVARWALTSADRDVRLAAAEALIRGQARRRTWALAGRDIVAACLGDSWCRVRAAAAEAIFGLRDAPAATAGAPIGRRTLRAHWLIGQALRSWDAVLALGDDATPALRAALNDDDPAVRREAAQALARQFVEPPPALPRGESAGTTLYTSSETAAVPTAEAP